MTKNIYVNLEADVSKIVEQLKKEKSSKIILVCPKRCFLFNDSINLRLLKKQADLMGKTVFILTMDERGQLYAKEAGFNLRFLSKTTKVRSVSDIAFIKHKDFEEKQEETMAEANKHPGLISHTVKEIKNIAKLFKGETGQLDKETNLVNKVLIKDNIFPVELSKAKKIKRKKLFSFRTAMFLVILSVLLAFLIVFVILPKAEVIIYPRSENLVRDMEITMSINIKSPDPNKLVIPATKINEVVEYKNRFQSQGKKEVGNKAMGTVQIYNFTRSPLNLKANTTVLQIGNKSYYLTADALQIKPTGYKNLTTKEIDENTLSVPVEIIAAEGGESYNIPAGTRLEITNQIFGSKPKLLYAKNVTPISGGTTRYLSVISENDITETQKNLINSAVNSVREKIQKNSLILIDKAYQTEVIEYTTDKPVGTESPNFDAYVKIRISGLAFNSDQLQQLVFSRISQTLAANKSLETNKPEQITYQIKNLDMDNELAVLFLHFQGQAFYNIDLKNMTANLIGKNTQRANEIISSNNNEVERIDIFLAPSWQKNLPWFANKIELKVEKEVGR